VILDYNNNLLGQPGLVLGTYPDTRINTRFTTKVVPGSKSLHELRLMKVCSVIL